MPESVSTNAPELSVSELSAALKRTIEDRFAFVRVRGEISNYRGPHSSGHAYFCLKDQTARLDAVIWKGVFGRLKFKPQEGLEVVATGKITTFPGKSNYQIVIEAIEPAGVGALMALLEERRRKLAAEGLFDEARKRLVPFLPRRVGVVTSPTGAVIRDILHRIADRFPRHVLVWPVRVQGETSATEIAAAIEGFNALPAEGPLQRPDVIILARGGGSLEDLWSFNEEIVVRAAAASAIPLIAAVGHETDWTLVDLAADLRAPTPTAAAEKAVPVRAELAAGLADLGRRHAGAALRLFARRRNDLRALLRALPQRDAILALPRQRLDNAANRFSAALARNEDRRRIAVARLSHRLAQQSPHARMGRAEERVKSLWARANQGAAIGLRSKAESLFRLEGRLPKAIARVVEGNSVVLANLSRLLGQQSPQATLVRAKEKVQFLNANLRRCVAAQLREDQDALSRVCNRMSSARAAQARMHLERTERARQRLLSADERMARAFAARIAAQRARVAALSQLFDSLNYKQVLARGFALVRDADQKPVRMAAQIEDGAALEIEFRDGYKQAIAGPPGAPAPAKRAPRKPARPKGQDSLF